MAERCVWRSSSAWRRSARQAVRNHTEFVTQSPQRRRIGTSSAAIPDIVPHEYPVDPIPRQRTRRESVLNAKPFSEFLTDNYHRQHDYLRISITEKCNLRCLYCMPEEGVPQSPPPDLLTSPEIYMLSSVFVSQGVTKIRLTGGEPTVRRDILPLMHQIGSLRSHGLKELCLTTNGISLHRKLDSMVEAGLTGVNLSLDTLDPWQFQIMTRRKGFEAVMKSIERMLEMNSVGARIKLKINCVVMRGMNEREIIPFVEMGREKDLEVRFIEYMPFDGNKWSKGKMLGYQEMLDIIRAKYPDVRKVQDHKNDTSKTYEIPGFKGRMGFITSMTHNFCGSCNRLRITSDGNLKVCLFGNAEVSLRDILRESNKNQPIDDEALEAIRQIELDRRQGQTTGTIGIAPNEQRLLDIIGMAVKRKKEKHAGMDDLKNMKNRPMILIDEDYRPQRKSIWVPPVSATACSPWRTIPKHLLGSSASCVGIRTFSSTARSHNASNSTSKPEQEPKLTHLTTAGDAHMVSISSKSVTKRSATAVCSVHFSNTTSVQLIRDNGNKKGDVLGVARIAGIMAAKQTSALIPLCHPIAITHVSVQVDIAGVPAAVADARSEVTRSGDSVASNSVPWAGTGQGDSYEWTADWKPQAGLDVSGIQSIKPQNGRIDVTATVACDGKTGVEMEALMAASTAALTIYDMCKAVDKGMRIEGLKVVRKEGGKSGTWIEGQREI